MFALGLGIQVSLKLIFNLKKILKSPMSLKQIFFKKDLFNLGLFLGGSSGIFRVKFQFFFLVFIL